MPMQEPGRLVLIESLPGHRIRLSDANRLVLIDEAALVCSPEDYRILGLFLSSPERVIPFAQLLGEGTHPHNQLARQNLRKRISRLRARLWPCGFDLRCVLGQGYLLCPLSEEE